MGAIEKCDVGERERFDTLSSSEEEREEAS